MAEVGWAAMLAAGDVSGFNEKRSERSRPELFAADLAGSSLKGVDLSNANMEKSDLTGADLTEANLMRANLSGIDGTGMNLTDALGLRARFKEAWMDGVDLTGADFAQATFSDANLQGSRGTYVRMPQAKLRGCNAEGVLWPEVDLSEAKLHQATFANADLRSADLTAASGAEADFSGANLDGVLATEARFPGARFVGARLGQARMQRINLSNADLSGADLSAADLSQANLSGANLTNAVLKGAVLADANLEGAVLTGVDLTDADLSGLEPVELGLPESILEELAAWGVPWDPDAPWVFTSVSVARRGKRYAIAWINPEGDERRSVRWAVLGGSRLQHGAVPVPAESVIDLQLAADAEGFTVMVLRDRPEGVVVGVYPLRDGQLGASRSAPLGYEPVVKPVLLEVDGRVHMLGLARRGPTLVVSDLSADPPEVLDSGRVGTAQGFLRGQPVLSCKGGVVIPIHGSRAGSPRRTPEGFPGIRGLVAPITGSDVLIAVWVVPRVGDRPGGLRTAEIGRRHAPVAEVVGSLAGVVALDAVQEGEHLRVLWAVAGDDGQGETTLRTMVLPDGEPEDLDAPDDLFEIRMAPGIAALIRMGGDLVLIDPSSGKLLATAGA
ncbi:MAG TPA: pentapeptide repeat-containing protein [Deltaproteobacteria bacterium]|nr:pentapeptide repeat-containing protein [Deltaproteobacteria bacterium]